VLAEVPDDPMTPDWVAVTTVGMRRWLALELARRLGASTPAAGDGVTANIEFVFPGALRQAVLEAGCGEGGDAWNIDHLVWAVLEVLASRRGDKLLGPLNTLPPGATWFGRARHLADLFDRYAMRRPELVLAWNAGRDVDAAGRPLGEHWRWQAHLWRLVRERVGVPSPPERLPELLADLHRGALDLSLPQRLSVFGVTTLPGGEAFIDLLQGLAATRDVHLMLLDPSPATTEQVRKACLAFGSRTNVARADDTSEAQVSHPLLQSWGRPYRERTVLLASAESRGVGHPMALDAPPRPLGTPGSLLARLQDDLLSGRAPAGDHELADGDVSVQVHSCHGQARQVQVLRDAIAHLLADDPSLREEDIVVLSPAIDQFAPLVQAGFGPSAKDGDTPQASGPPRLAYRITDRSLAESCPVLGALDALLALVAGRFTASQVLEFISLPPVRKRFELDDKGLGTIADWMERTNVRWGLDGLHREGWGLPADFTANSWRAGIDRVLLGVALSDGDTSLGPGEIAPLGVEGSDIALAGRLADVLARLGVMVTDLHHPRTVTDWCEALVDAVDLFFEVDEAERWQTVRARGTIAEIADHASIADRPSSVEVSLSEIRRILGDQIEDISQHADFFRGGITVSSLTPLRWLPFRVVCLLGMDEASTTAAGSSADGDDLAAAAPLVGDRDPRAEVRQAFLEALLAASDHLVITRTGRDITTNQPVPCATVFAELRDTIAATLAPESRPAFWNRIETVHPRQAFDERCFQPNQLNRADPWSFDSRALVGTRARRARDGNREEFLSEPLPADPRGEPTISLGELKQFLTHPAKTFLHRRLHIALPDDERAPSDDLPTQLNALERWSVGDRMLRARLAGQDPAACERYEESLGTLPPGGMGQSTLSAVSQSVECLLERAAMSNIDPKRDLRLEVDVVLRDGEHIIDTLVGACGGSSPGTATVTCSKLGPKHLLPAWLDLIALTATQPATTWRSVVVGNPTKQGGLPQVVELVMRGDTPEQCKAQALEALEIVMDLYRRALNEPIPLFPSLSYALHHNTQKASDWNGYNGQGDGNNDANRLAFGDLRLDELLAIPARDYDPPGSQPKRAKRFASYLWGAVEQSSEEVQ
jgi:exodeoxyribonuclease V gamma subunit